MQRWYQFNSNWLCFLSFFLFVVAGCKENAAGQISKPTLNVLFIGNSYTYANGFPEILRFITNSDHQSPVNLHVESVVEGGANLSTHWKRGVALQAIQNGIQWDYVIIQNQSQWAFFEQDRKAALYYGKKIVSAIDAVGAVPVFFVTWPREPGSIDYVRSRFMKDFSYSYRTINRHSKIVAKNIGAEIIPVSSYWYVTMRQMRGINLYSDGSHPSLVGTYLNALVFYKYLIGVPYVNESPVINGLGKETMLALQAIVSRAHEFEKDSQ